MARYFVLFFAIMIIFGGVIASSSNAVDQMATAYAQEENISHNYTDSTLGLKADLPEKWMTIESTVYENNVPMNVILSFPPLAILGGSDDFIGIMIAYSDNKSLSSVSYFESLKSSGCILTNNNVTILELNKMKAMEFNLKCTPSGFGYSEIDALGYSVVTKEHTFFAIFLGSESQNRSSLIEFEEFKNSFYIENTIDLSDKDMTSSTYDISIKQLDKKTTENLNIPIILSRSSEIQNFKFDDEKSSILFTPVANNEDYFQVDVGLDNILDPLYTVETAGKEAEYFIVTDTTNDKTTVSIQIYSPQGEITITGQPIQSIEDVSKIDSSDSTLIPEWVKTNAKWWTEGKIDDYSFISGIEYLIKKDVIQVPTNNLDYSQENSKTIPFWVKNNADWWSRELISDDEFKGGIQYLIQNGIIQIGPII